MVEIVELNLEPPEKYVVKGHNLKDIDIEKAIENHFDDEIKILDKYETWCHWCYGYFNDVVPQRYCLFDNKYKGVCGGFAITVITDVEYKDRNRRNDVKQQVDK